MIEMFPHLSIRNVKINACLNFLKLYILKLKIVSNFIAVNIVIEKIWGNYDRREE